jgi:hypothetical protein
MEHSESMSSMQQLLLQYQQAGNRLLGALSSSAWTVRDIAFYSAALAVPALFVSALDVKLALTGLGLLSLCLEGSFPVSDAIC